MRNKTTAPRANKPRKPYVTENTRDDVCNLVRVSFIGYWDGSERVLGNRSRSIAVPQARVSEVFELVSQALAGLIEKPLDNEERRA